MENLTTVVKSVTVYACSHVSLITTNMMDYAQVAIEHGDLESFEEWLEEAYTPFALYMLFTTRSSILAATQELQKEYNYHVSDILTQLFENSQDYWSDVLNIVTTVAIDFKEETVKGEIEVA